MIALTGGKILPVAGDPIEKGTVLVEDGKIKAVGADPEVPAGAQGGRRDRHVGHARPD